MVTTRLTRKNLAALIPLFLFAACGDSGDGGVLPDAPDEGPLEPASQIEINVLDTGSGVLSIVLVVAENGSMETFGADALALAETITITSTKDEADPSC